MSLRRPYSIVRSVPHDLHTEAGRRRTIIVRIPGRRSLYDLSLRKVIQILTNRKAVACKHVVTDIVRSPQGHRAETVR